MHSQTIKVKYIIMTKFHTKQRISFLYFQAAYCQKILNKEYPSIFPIYSTQNTLKLVTDEIKRLEEIQRSIALEKKT